MRSINSRLARGKWLFVRAERYGTKELLMAMESSAVDYHRLSEETRDTVMAYVEQEWPVTKTSVSSNSWREIEGQLVVATCVVNGSMK